MVKFRGVSFLAEPSTEVLIDSSSIVFKGTKEGSLRGIGEMIQNFCSKFR